MNQGAMVKICVIGAGANGLACAVKIKEKYQNYDVTVISHLFSPATTGDGSGGLWYPYLCGDTPQHLLTKWGIETYEYLHKLWLEGGYDISVTPIYTLYREPQVPSDLEWSKHVYGYRELDQSQLSYLSRMSAVQYVCGQTFNTFVVVPPTLLKHFHQKLATCGVRILNAKVASLRDPILDDYDVIVNCIGLGAREMVPDTTTFSIRGQIAKVIAPWMYSVVMDETTGHYIIPNTHTCVLGGTHQVDNYNTSVDETDKRFVLDGCREIIPPMKDAAVMNHWVGLRPGRQEVRLESEVMGNKLYIHNYGHGGSGLTLFWGCATDVLHLLEKIHLDKNSTRKLKSML